MGSPAPPHTQPPVPASPAAPSASLSEIKICFRWECWVAAAVALSHWAGDAQDTQGQAPHAGGHDGEQTPAIPITLNKTLCLSQRGS